MNELVIKKKTDPIVSNTQNYKERERRRETVISKLSTIYH